LLQSPRLVFLFIGNEVFLISSCMSTIEICFSTHDKHEGMWKLDALDVLFCTSLKLCKTYFQNLSLIHKNTSTKM
jgi:hypothetical protein